MDNNLFFFFYFFSISIFNIRMILSLMSCNQQFTVMICEKLAVDLIPPKPEEGFELQESDLIGHYAEGIAIRLVASIPTATSFLMEVCILYDNFLILLKTVLIFSIITLEFN